MRKLSLVLLILLIGWVKSNDLHFVTEKKDALIGSIVKDFVDIKYPNYRFRTFVYVSIKKQKLYVVKDSTIFMQFPISSSKFGVGSDYGSEKTPLGLHKIESKIGENTPLGGIIIGKDYSGNNAIILTEAKSSGKDEVTTRALRLQGLEKGINKGGNKDSYKRDIYIHGTPEEGLIGTPASHGCIRMKNEDVIRLYNYISNDTYVIILDN